MWVESSSAWNLPFFLTGWRSCFRVCRPTSLMQTVSFQLRVKCGAAQSLDVQEFFRNKFRIERRGAGEVSLPSPFSQIFPLCPASRWMRAGIWQAQGERLLSGIPSPEKARAVLRSRGCGRAGISAAVLPFLRAISRNMTKIKKKEQENELFSFLSFLSMAFLSLIYLNCRIFIFEYALCLEKTACRRRRKGGICY